MKNVWKPLCVLAIIALAVLMVFTLAFSPASQAVLYPVLTVCIVFAVGWLVKSVNPAFVKRFTAATGV